MLRRLSQETLRRRSRLVQLAVGTILAAMAVWLAFFPASNFLVRASYDLLHWLAPGEISRDFPVAIVYIDLPSHIRLNHDPARPWPRALHAELVRRLKRAGAKAVVFDVLFAEPGDDPKADHDFAEAIRDGGRVILGAEWNRGGRQDAGGNGYDERSIVLPAPELREAAAGYGFVFSKVQTDFEVRELFPGFLDRDLPSLSWAAARLLGLGPVEPGRWIRYYGPPLSLPHVSIADALDPAAAPADFFRDKVVFVGARPEAGRFDERRDELRNPFSALARGVLFMPGVEVHATQLANILRRDGLWRLPPGWESLLLAASGFFWGVILLRLRPIPAGLAGLGAEAVTIAAATLAFRGFGLWLPWLLISVVQIPGAWLASVAVQSIEWYAERRRYLARIRQQAALIDRAQDAIVVYTLAGDVLFRNPKAAELFGGSNPDILSEELRSAWEAALEQGEWTGEIIHDHRVLHSHWTLLRDEKEAPAQFLLVNTDISEKKRLEEQFARAQRLEGLWAMAGGMAHDLNNALAPVVMGLPRLRKKAADQEELIDVMQDAARRSAEMVQQVLATARNRTVDHTLVKPSSLLRELEQALAFLLPKNISSSVLCPPDVWAFIGNKTQIHQVLLNLCLNARDAMADGGELTVAVDNVSVTAEAAAKVPGLVPGDYVLFMVSDTGRGIPPERLPKLFEPFATSKAEGRGTGLGLFTSLHVVRSHQGALHVESEAGNGTTFEIYLPRAVKT